MADDQFDARWQEVVNLTAEEFWKHDQNPGGGVFKADRKELKLYGILKDGSYHSEKFTPEQIIRRDPAQIAQHFYESYRAARDAP